MNSHKIPLVNTSLGSFGFSIPVTESTETTPKSIRTLTNSPDVMLVAAAVTSDQPTIETLAGILGRIEAELGRDDEVRRLGESIETNHELHSVRRFVWNWGAGLRERLAVTIAFDQDQMLVLKVNYPEGLHDEYRNSAEAILSSVHQVSFAQPSPGV